MALNRWSLGKLVALIGAVALLVLFVPVGFYLTHTLTLAAERRVSERGQGLGQALARQIADALLVEDWLSVHDALLKGAGGDPDVRYICVVNPRGAVVAQTFEKGCPAGLPELWEQHSGPVVRFRTEEGPLLDVATPILEGQLGTLHLGVSRAEAVRASRRAASAAVAALLVALCVVFLGARLVASRVSRPLRELETAVSRFPHREGSGEGWSVSGTREVESLARRFADLTERLEALERERAATQDRMIHAERLATLGELAAGLAHEIQNPLDGMIECVRYLEQDRAKSERTARYVPMFKDGLQRIAAVMQHVLTFARVGHDVSVEVCETADVIDSLAAMLQAQLNTRHIRLTVRRPGGCACVCNAHALSQAVLNLALNAMEAVDGRVEPELWVEARCDARWIYIAVEDNGPGVPADLRERIFEPFFTTRPVGEGTGLGLSISRQLVRAVGGELELAQEPSRLGGARFVIRLAKASEAECCDEPVEG